MLTSLPDELSAEKWGEGVKAFPPVIPRNPVPHFAINHQISVNIARGLPEIDRAVPPHDRPMVVVGSAPSLADTYQDIPGSGYVVAVGGALDWLIDNGIMPDAYLAADPHPFLMNHFDMPQPDVHYYLSSCVLPLIFDRLAECRITVWHSRIGCATEELLQQRADETGQKAICIGGGTTAAMRAPFVGWWLGYRHFIFHGVDSSNRDGASHLAFGRKTPEPRPFSWGGRDFMCAPGWVMQARDYYKIRRTMTDCTFDVRGDGLIPHMHAVLEREAAA